jgi:hypothetical protein
VEPVRWQLILESGASLKSVITHGQYEQRVDGAPAGVPVVSWSPPSGFGCMYGWEVEANLGGCDYWTLIGEVRTFTGLVETSFQGCYRGDRFEIPHWTGEPPTCRADVVTGDESIARADVELPGCERVAAETRYCLTLANDYSSSDGWRVTVLGLDSGRTCPLRPVDPGLTLYDEASSIGWRGELLYVCTERGLVRISLRDGSWEAAQVPCQAVAADEGRLYVMPSWRDTLSRGASFDAVYAYADYRAVLGGAYDRIYTLPTSSRMTAQGDRLFGAWHSTDTIEVVDVESGSALPPIELEDYDDWIDGMSVTADGRLVVTHWGPAGGSTVVIFDAQTGERLGELAVPEMITGLACVSRTCIRPPRRRRRPNRRRERPPRSHRRE